MLGVISWPILERIPLVGDLAISPHGLTVAAGFLLGGWMMVRRSRRSGIGVEVDDVSAAVSDLLTWVGVGAVVGARFFYVANHLAAFRDNPWSTLAVWQGGLTLLGGITGGVVTGVLLARRRGWSPAKLVDAAAAGLAAGIAIGRLGDLAIGDHLGAAAPDALLAWQCTGNFWVEASNNLGRVAPSAYPTGVAAPVQGCFDIPVVQTALFDSVAAAATLVVVIMVERRIRGRARTGLLAATFVLAYGTGRLVLDSLRGDLRYAGLTASQWTALTAVTVALAWLMGSRRRTTAGRDKGDEADQPPPDATTASVDPED